MHLKYFMLKYRISPLNYDLYKICVRTDPNCLCGYWCENSCHFLIEYPLYISKRCIMIQTLQNIVENKVDIYLGLSLNRNKCRLYAATS